MNIITFALISFFAYFIGCGQKPKLSEKTIIVKEFYPVASKNFAGHSDLENLTISRDGKSIYVTANNNGDLFYGDASTGEIKWKQIPLHTGLSGGVGQAKLEYARTVTQVSPGEEGGLISVRGNHPAGSPAGTLNDNGAFYLAKDQHLAAWVSNVQDLGTLSYGDPPMPFRFKYNAKATGILVKGIDGKDVPYFLGKSSQAPNNIIAKTRKDLTAAQVFGLVVRGTHPFTGFPLLISSRDYLFAVSSEGISTMPSANIGVTATFSDVEANTSAQNNGAIGSDSFKIKEVGGHVNNTVQAVAIFKDDLYIGFKGADFSGGVFVYHIKPVGSAPEVSAPDKRWRGISVTALIATKTSVWAVTPNDIFKAHANGERGESYFDALPLASSEFDDPKDGYLKESFPLKIARAIFVNDGLMFLVKNKGLFAVKEIKKTIYSDERAHE